MNEIKKAWAEGKRVQFRTEMGWVDWAHKDWICLSDAVSWRVAEEEPPRTIPVNWEEVKRAWAEGRLIEYTPGEDVCWRQWFSDMRLDPAGGKYWRAATATWIRTLRTPDGEFTVQKWLRGKYSDEPPCPEGHTAVTKWSEVP